MSVDSTIAQSFVQLTNFFASEYENAEEISSLTDLWQKQGNMMSVMMRCDTREFRTSDLFYEVLHRKIRMANGSLAEALDPRKAAEGDHLEISKFYALFLEVLRKDQAARLTQVLEKLAQQSRFNVQPILEIFEHIDELYSEDSVENWWTCLLQTENRDVLTGLRTPPRESYMTSTAFATPTATAHRLRTATSTAKRSPIAEVVDSPTIKCMRMRRELQQAITRMKAAEHQAEELERENADLKQETRSHKLTIDGLKGEITEQRGTVEKAEQRAQEVANLLEAKQVETETLTQQLNQSRLTLRTEQRHLEEIEKENEKMRAKLASTQKDLDNRMKEMREQRDTNESDFRRYRLNEDELTEKLRVAEEEIAILKEHLLSLEEYRTQIQSDNKRLTDALEEMSLASSLNKQDADNAKTHLAEERNRFDKEMEDSQTSHKKCMKMANEHIERLQKELKNARTDKNDLQALLDDLNAKVMKADEGSHEQVEGFLDAKACLDRAKQRIERLEIDVDGKEATNHILLRQLEQSKELLRNEERMREQSMSQFSRKFENLTAECQKKQAEIDLMVDNMQSLILKHQNELVERDSTIRICEEQNEKLSSQLDALTKKNTEVTGKNSYLEETIKIFQSDSRAPRASSLDSLVDFLDSEAGTETEEQLREIMDQTPRKSVAFSVDLNFDEATSKGTPIGFKNNPRDSICSIDPFDRSSMTRSSLRSDTMTISSNCEFKLPYTPSGTSKERIGVLTSRNEKVKPHLQSAYTVEMSNVSSPSADEENVRKGGAGEKLPKKKRRDSIFSNIFQKNNK